MKLRYTYHAGKLLPYETTTHKVRRWSQRLQRKTGQFVYYTVTAAKVEVFHGGEMSNADHNKAVQSLAGILGKMGVLA